MRFLIDAQLPPALAALFHDLGHAAEHVMDVGPGDATDHAIWTYAKAHGAVIVTKDEDFSVMSTMRGEGPPIVWVRVGNTRRAVLLAWLEPLIPQIVTAVESGNSVIELR